MENTNSDSWAVAELMGHLTLAGRITKPGEYGGLWQIDIPDGETFHTEFFGSTSVYRIRIVSEEIARAYAKQSNEIIAYDAPIITRAEHEAALDRAREMNSNLQEKVWKLEHQLRALPAGASDEAIPGVAEHIEELWEDVSDDEEDEL